ncbi:MAG: hypothetical protein KY429_11425 [Actinobacteria bacterium]|nr:hypothetical protein [Actinomycetota bacterium]
MTSQQALELVVLLGSKIREGGVVVVETLNPRSLGSVPHDYFRDPSHRNMFDPDLLSFLFKEAGFSSAEPSWDGPPGEAQRYTLLAVR